MSILTIQHETGAGPTEVYKDFERIANKLDDAGILFEHWKTDADLKPEDGQEEVLECYRDSVERIKKM